MVVIVSNEADRLHPVASIVFDSIQPVSIDQNIFDRTQYVRYSSQSRAPSALDLIVRTECIQQQQQTIITSATITSQARSSRSDV
jgi:hypothetical protein